MTTVVWLEDVRYFVTEVLCIPEYIKRKNQDYEVLKAREHMRRFDWQLQMFIYVARRKIARQDSDWMISEDDVDSFLAAPFSEDDTMAVLNANFAVSLRIPRVCRAVCIREVNDAFFMDYYNSEKDDVVQFVHWSSELSTALQRLRFAQGGRIRCWNVEESRLARARICGSDTYSFWHEYVKFVRQEDGWKWDITPSLSSISGQGGINCTK